MKKHNDKLMKFVQSKGFPFLIYLRNGNLLKSYGVSQDTIFITKYYYLYKETKDCYVLRLLSPVIFCEQLFLRPTTSTVTVKKENILGIQWLYDVKVASTLVLHQHYNDCVEGKFHIAEGYQETTIWQSNLDDNYEGEALLYYTDGTEEFLRVKVTYKSYITQDFKLFKISPITLDLDAVRTIEITKQKVPQVAGSYMIDVKSLTKTKVKI